MGRHRRLRPTERAVRVGRATVGLAVTLLALVVTVVTPLRLGALRRTRRVAQWPNRAGSNRAR
jgi:predicted MFS family arabinose efflux permease